MLTVTVAASFLGNRSTPRSRNEKMPSTTRLMMSIVVKAGRRTHSSKSDISGSSTTRDATTSARRASPGCHREFYANRRDFRVCLTCGGFLASCPAGQTAPDDRCGLRGTVPEFGEGLLKKRWPRGGRLG